MSLGRLRSTLLASALVLASVVASHAAGAAGGGTPGPFGLVPPPPPEPEAARAFDAPRKPPVPVSFLSHDAGWVSFQYPPSARERVAPLIAQADDLRAELAEALGQTPLEGVEVRVARGPEEMMTLAPQEALPTTDPTGTAFAPLKLLILSLGSGGDPVDLVDAFRRELAHLALGEAVLANKVPAWFTAGFAVHYSRESEWAREWSLLRAALRHRTEPIASLDRLLERRGGQSSLLPLAEGVDFVTFLLKPEKHARFAATVERIRHGEGFESAIGSGYGADLASLERDWRAQLSQRTTLTAVLVGIGFPASALLAAFATRRMKRRKQLLRAKEQSEKQERRGRSPDSGRVHIVFNRREERVLAPIIAEPEIPKVEHEGEWHTLH